MTFSVSMGQAIPGTDIIETVSVGTIDFRRGFLRLETASLEYKTIYSDFLQIIGGHATVNIINSIHDFTDVLIVAELPIELDIVEIDYDTLSVDNKEKIDKFAELLNSIAD
jgi:hypothetical protein